MTDAEEAEVKEMADDLHRYLHEKYGDRYGAEDISALLILVAAGLDSVHGVDAGEAIEQYRRHRMGFDVVLSAETVKCA